MQQNLAQVLQDMGRDIAVPGVELAINLLQELLVDLKHQRKDVPVPTKRLGRPPGVKQGRGAWLHESGRPMTKEERSIEMKRRQAVSEAKRGNPVKIKGMHPRDPNHPGHDQWISRLRESQKKHAASLSPAQRRARANKGARTRTARAAVDEMKVAS